MSTKVNLVPDENGNDPFVQISGTNIMQPVDVQSHLQTTIQTHNAVSVAGSGSSAETNYHDISGYITLSATLASDAATTNTLVVYWSNDGTNLQGAENIIASGTPVAGGGNNRCGNVTVKARYFKFCILNGDTVAHTMSVWAYPQT